MASGGRPHAAGLCAFRPPVARPGLPARHRRGRAGFGRRHGRRLLATLRRNPPVNPAYPAAQRRPLHAAHGCPAWRDADATGRFQHCMVLTHLFYLLKLV